MRMRNEGWGFRGAGGLWDGGRGKRWFREQTGDGLEKREGEIEGTSGSGRGASLCIATSKHSMLSISCSV